MEGTFKESFINQKNKTLLAFYSITEKQDESGYSSVNESKFGKKLITDDNSKKHFLKFSEPTKIHNKTEAKPAIKSSFLKKKVLSHLIQKKKKIKI